MKASNILKAFLITATTIVCTAVDCDTSDDEWAALTFTNESAQDIYMTLEFHPSKDLESLYPGDPLERINTIRVESKRTRSIGSWTMKEITEGYLKDDRIPVIIRDAGSLDTLSTYSLLPSELYDLSGKLSYPASDKMKQILDVEER